MDFRHGRRVSASFVLDRVEQRSDTTAHTPLQLPFGPVLRTFASKDELYAAFPHVSDDLDVNGLLGEAPFGSDLPLRSGDPVTGRYRLTVCHAWSDLTNTDPSGPAVAFDRATGLIHLLAEDITFSEARRRWLPRDTRLARLARFFRR